MYFYYTAGCKMAPQYTTNLSINHKTIIIHIEVLHFSRTESTIKLIQEDQQLGTPQSLLGERCPQEPIIYANPKSYCCISIPSPPPPHDQKRPDGSVTLKLSPIVRDFNPKSPAKECIILLEAEKFVILFSEGYIIDYSVSFSTLHQRCYQHFS